MIKHEAKVETTCNLFVFYQCIYAVNFQAYRSLHCKSAIITLFRFVPYSYTIIHPPSSISPSLSGLLYTVNSIHEETHLNGVKSTATLLYKTTCKLLRLNVRLLPTEM